MGVYIKGMKIPNDCDQCPFIFYDADVNERSWCEAVKPYGIDVTDCQGKRHSDCPLVEVKPHGRLIDADALRSLYDNIAYDADGITNEEFDKMTVSVAVIRQNIDDMPTIIEAEDSVKRAKWEKHNDGIMYWWECSRCHVTVEYNEDELTNYCSHCGAKMEIIEAEQQT